MRVLPYAAAHPALAATISTFREVVFLRIEPVFSTLRSGHTHAHSTKVEPREFHWGSAIWANAIQGRMAASVHQPVGIGSKFGAVRVSYGDGQSTVDHAQRMWGTGSCRLSRRASAAAHSRSRSMIKEATRPTNKRPDENYRYSCRKR
jgi:hypothetical protein